MHRGMPMTRMSAWARPHGLVGDARPDATAVARCRGRNGKSGAKGPAGTDSAAHRNRHPRVTGAGGHGAATATNQARRRRRRICGTPASPAASSAVCWRSVLAGRTSPSVFPTASAASSDSASYGSSAAGCRPANRLSAELSSVRGSPGTTPRRTLFSRTQIGAAISASRSSESPRTSRCNPIGSEERRVGKECRSRWSPYH